MTTARDPARPPRFPLTAALPGLTLAAVLAAAATALAGWVGVDLLGFETSPISPILLAVLLGLVVGNSIGLPERFTPGIELAARRLLRVGVALLGIRLSLGAVAGIGLVALPLVAACIAVAMLAVMALARGLRLPPRLALLIATGTSICGISAIVAIAPIIDAEEHETSYAVATIALFGTATLFAYPFLAHLLFDTATQAGLFLGTSIHDTSQVVGAALAHAEQYRAPQALDTAVVTKLVRNLSMIIVIPVIGLIHRRRAGDGNGHDAPRPRGVVPLFVLGFLAMALLRTTGDMGGAAFGVLPPDAWAVAVAGIQRVAEIALLLAMAAVGLGTTLRKLAVLGLAPLAAGLAAALSVGAASALLVRALGALDLLPLS